MDEMDREFDSSKSGVTHDGEYAHYRTKGKGIRINHPSAYSKKGWSSMEYYPSTRRETYGGDTERGQEAIRSVILGIRRAAQDKTANKKRRNK